MHMAKPVLAPINSQHGEVYGLSAACAGFKGLMSYKQNISCTHTV